MSSPGKRTAWSFDSGGDKPRPYGVHPIRLGDTEVRGGYSTVPKIV